mgnify:CR=1 FL=1
MPKTDLQGTVVSKAGKKTLIVRVDRRVAHPVYEKVVRRSKKFAVHDENEDCEVRSIVRIRETRTYSKTKTTKIVSDST